ncbi:hypothetical protein JFT33_08890 [Pseudomonas carnis]|uniref:hypothetical protein n=1 Tax=Pseudomonas carnis TaxID=2487355 RepID=UPI0018E7AAB7|nr:hypothetical protein [Pseudomonas carnis]MBJ2206697.1 hypothetical protein [Pseudomonas carnis]
MPVQGNEKRKLEKTINDIASGNFDERDVDQLFMGLRAHSEGYFAFREIADFVAHNDLRNKGFINNSLEAMYLSMKYLIDFTLKNIPLDLTKPFPAYIKKHFKYQINKIEEETLRKDLNLTQSRASSRIDNLFTENQKTKTAELKRDHIKDNDKKLIEYLIGRVIARPTYTAEELISELLAVLKLNNLEVDTQRLKSQTDKITLCILVLIHNTKYEINAEKHALCKIQCEHSSIPYNTRYVDIDGQEVHIEHSFGNLCINGEVSVPNGEHESIISHAILKTNLSVSSWCSDEMFSIKTHDHDFQTNEISFDAHLGIGDDFKLIPIR